MNLPLKRRPVFGFTKDGPHGMKPGEATPETDPSGGLRHPLMLSKELFNEFHDSEPEDCLEETCAPLCVSWMTD